MDSITAIVLIFFLIPALLLTPIVIMIFFHAIGEHDTPAYVNDEPDGSNYVTMPDGERRLD